MVVKIFSLMIKIGLASTSLFRRELNDLVIASTLFCLMSTHVHLAIQVAGVSLSRILQNLSFRYTRWIN